MNRAVIDVNVLLALMDDKDKWHSEAKAIAQILKDKGWEIIYLDCVINEVISVLGRRLEERIESQNFAGIMERLKELVPEEEIEWVYPDVPDLYGDITKLVKEKQGRLNFHDALMALFAKEHQLVHFISFDVDFDKIDWIKRLKSRGEIE